jgi:hypothetical protein
MVNARARQRFFGDKHGDITRLYWIETILTHYNNSITYIALEQIRYLNSEPVNELMQLWTEELHKDITFLIFNVYVVDTTGLRLYGDINYWSYLVRLCGRHKLQIIGLESGTTGKPGRNSSQEVEDALWVSRLRSRCIVFVGKLHVTGMARKDTAQKAFINRVYTSSTGQVTYCIGSEYEDKYTKGSVITIG